MIELDSEDIEAINHAMQHLKKFQHNVYSFGIVPFWCDGELIGEFEELSNGWNFRTNNNR